jgi:hypothetical protein
MTDNDFITKCARTARDLIGPDQISETPPAPAPAVEDEASAVEGTEGATGGAPSETK